LQGPAEDELIPDSKRGTPRQPLSNVLRFTYADRRPIKKAQAATLASLLVARAFALWRRSNNGETALPSSRAQSSVLLIGTDELHPNVYLLTLSQQS
jgi:hypothetical protein